MCGIAGIFAYDSAAEPVDFKELHRIRDAMVHRGPDGAGVWRSADKRVGLGHRRLAIIDIGESGAQPMASGDGRFHIIFNGEIYNYRELRKELQGKGHVFRSNSDTEVLLHLYADRREQMVHAIRGMYAFAIWDEKIKELFLVRDPLGIKPLYYADNGKSIRFASQVKALLKSENIDLGPEPAGSVGFLVWGYVPEPYTLYRGIQALPSGAWMRISSGGAKSTQRFFSIQDELRRAEQSPRIARAEANDILTEAVRDSVRHHLVSDVPLGIFLSAGVDSATVAQIAADEGGKLDAVTLGFPEFRGTEKDEVPIAAKLATRAGFRHHAHWITHEDFESELPRIKDMMDQPSIDGVNTYFVSRAAARIGMKVALSGVGGDELFGGYPSFSQVPRLAASLGPLRAPDFLGTLARVLTSSLISRVTSPKYSSLLEYGSSFAGAYLLRRALFMPWEAKSVLDAATVRVGLEKLQIIETLKSSMGGVLGERARIVALEFSWYMRNQLLRDADWAGMAHSLEIRVPLVDVNLFRALAPLIVTDYPAKSDFARATRLPLPVEILARPKTGFETPVKQWISEYTVDTRQQRGLRAWAKRMLPPQPRMFRTVMLLTDAFGMSGGIAKFNQDLLSALSAMPECAEMVAIPRSKSSSCSAIPPRIKFLAHAAAGKLRFMKATVFEARRGPVDLVICGHINLAPLCVLLALLKRAPSVLIVHGIDAWQPHPSILVRSSLPFFRTIIGVSNVTLNRFSSWSRTKPSRLQLLPNCVDIRKFGPGPKQKQLAARLGLNDRKVIMTLGRLATEEQYKGFDEVIEALPALAQRVPDIAYLICGDGSDRARLEAKAKSLGVADRVVFAGFIPEDEKGDYYRLADAYVMPSRGEGFGITFLEALACGIPVVGGRYDGGREALLDGVLGRLVDPRRPDELVEAVMSALKAGCGQVPEKLNYYSWEAFKQRAEAIVRQALTQQGADGIRAW